MRCDQARERIGALLDGELPDADRQAVESHAAQCPACARTRDELRELRGELARMRDHAPRGLAQRIRAGLAVEAADLPEAAASVRPPNVSAARALSAARAWRRPAFLRYAAAVLLACAVSAGATWWLVRGVDAHDALARDVLSAHMRSLLQDNAVQVAALDTHTVKPWFAGRLEFTPVVKDLAAEGFQLVGGRLDYVDGRRVAAVVYRRRLHQVNVFSWPSRTGDAAAAHAKINGYNIVVVEPRRHDVLGGVRSQRGRTARAAVADLMR